jgi:hypothetical protein
MFNIWLIHTESFHPGVISHLTSMGIQVSYICTTPEQIDRLKATNPAYTLHSLWDAMLGLPPDSSKDKSTPSPPSAGLLEQLSFYESIALSMFERMNYEGLRVHDLRHYYLKYLSCWLDLIRANRPDAVVFQSAPHMGYDYVLYALCQVCGIKTLIVERTYLPDRLILIEKIEKMPLPESHQAQEGGLRETPGSFHPSNTEMLTEEPAETVGDPLNYYDVRNRPYQFKRRFRSAKVQLLNELWVMIAQPVKLFVWKLVKQFSKLFKPVRISIYGLSNPQPWLIKHLWHLWRDSIYRISLMLLYEFHTEPPDFDAQYVFFALQYQPERSSNPLGGVFADQLLALEIMTHSLPKGWSIYVKEHPRQFTNDFAPSIRLSRSKRFYESIYRNEKIRLMSPSELSDDLIRHSRCVATVAGTTGWEAVQRGIPAIVFGNPWYVNCPGVYRVSSTDQCAKALESIASGHIHVDQDQVASYIQGLISTATFRGYFGDFFKRDSSLTIEENARSYAEIVAAQLSADHKRS